MHTYNYNYMQLGQLFEFDSWQMRLRASPIQRSILRIFSKLKINLQATG